jgi:hypothetical protein
MTVPFTLTYGEVARGRLAVCEDSFRTVTIAVNQGSAAGTLRARRGDPLVIARLQAQPKGPVTRMSSFSARPPAAAAG